MNWNYQREERTSGATTGKQRCVIVSAEEQVSKSTGKPMIVVGVRPSGCAFTVKHYLVSGEYFNRNATQLFDAFPEIPEGSFNLLEWIGAEGAADFGLDPNGYLKIKYFIDSVKAADLPPYEGDKPKRQIVTSLDDGEPDFDDDDDLPFN